MAPQHHTLTYPVTGITGIALYRSIGRQGPKVGGSRTIAHAAFDLTWTRDYRPRADASCVLAVAPAASDHHLHAKALAALDPAVRAS